MENQTLGKMEKGQLVRVKNPLPDHAVVTYELDLFRNNRIITAYQLVFPERQPLSPVTFPVPDFEIVSEHRPPFEIGERVEWKDPRWHYGEVESEMHPKYKVKFYNSKRYVSFTNEVLGEDTHIVENSLDKKHLKLFHKNNVRNV